jgi:hypothetical protein
MPYYANKNLLFVHIPKTGGTKLEEYLMNTSVESLYCNRVSIMIPDTKLSQISLQHQVYNTIYKYRDLLGVDFSHPDFKVITIVRNPYDRIISDLFFRKLINRRSDNGKVYRIIVEYLKDNWDNHNIPQYKFITDENGDLIKGIKVFKTETLTKDLQDYGFSDYTGPESSNAYNKYLNQDSIGLISEFYKRDFELFNYCISLYTPHFHKNTDCLPNQIVPNTPLNF